MGPTRRRTPFWNRPWRAGGLIGLAAVGAAFATTDFKTPPRFDGAGYAVLAEALATGRGYREIDQPDAPRHAHFPPGYPAALSLVWRLTGRSERGAHALSVATTSAAVLLAWRWFSTFYGPRVAGLLGLALAANWTWNRNAGAIQSEPLYLLIGQLALLVAVRGRRGGGGVPSGAALGTLLAACVLTRHVAAALAAAVLVDLVAKGQTRRAIAAGLVCLLLLVPWAAWLAAVGTHTQAGLLTREGLPERVLTQGRFYVQRLPDQITGPFVEVATVFRRQGPLAVAANTWAAIASAALLVGWCRTLRTARKRLAGLTALSTLALLLVWPFTEAGRFLIPLVPCILVGAVEGLAAFVPVKRPRVVSAWLILAISLPYSAYALISDRAGAQRRTHVDFDAACSWVAREGRVPGPILTRHPGEVYWQTGRQALAPGSDSPAAIEAQIDRFAVAYLLTDEQRYVNAPESPLDAFARSDPGRLRAVWKRETGRSSIIVYEVIPATNGRAGARGGDDAGPRRPQRFGPSNTSRP